jgi:hypothetical protein
MANCFFGTGNKSVLFSGISIAKLDFLRPESPIFYIKVSVGSPENRKVHKFVWNSIFCWKPI